MENEILLEPDQGRDPSDILPNNIWNGILENVVDTQDLKNVSETCRQFTILVDSIKDKRIRNILMPQVIPVLAQWHSKPESGNGEELLVPLGNVCMRWKNEVDKALAIHENDVIQNRNSGMGFGASFQLKWFSLISNISFTASIQKA